jgi:hypothetical protein
MRRKVESRLVCASYLLISAEGPMVDSIENMCVMCMFPCSKWQLCVLLLFIRFNKETFTSSDLSWYKHFYV